MCDVSLPDSVTTIGNHAFCWTSLKSIDFPCSLVSIGDSAFILCDLSNVSCNAERVPECAEDAFDEDIDDDNRIDSILYVPASMVERYKAAAPWNQFKKIAPIDEEET